MTLQDDLARHWFQPLVPMAHEHKEQARPDPGPLTTRIVGELPPLDQPRTPAHPEPEQLEVTQPYIPAIRAEPPEFAKRLTPDRPSPPSATPGTAPAPPRPARSGETGPVEAPATEPGREPTEPAATEAPASQPRKRRSLARRVVRRIIGPDLLRKDPVRKRK